MMRSILIVAASLGLIALSHAEDKHSPATDFVAVAAAIHSTMQTYHYDPNALQSPGYSRMEAAVSALAASSTSKDAFIEGFGEIWQDGPFSHVELRAARQSADELAAYLDTMRVGGGGATLSWQGDVAILTVETMMGVDTIEQIDAAYDAIAGRKTDALIIDLRTNGGGAFAIRPLVAHLITEQVDAGCFVSQRWYRDHDRPPNRSELLATEPWDGWSIRAFWADVQTAALVRLSIAPAQPAFSGPVYVLTGRQTASAAELAADILKGSGRATLIGETTAGQMLSQKIFDIQGGFHLSLPIADYHSATSGRIEGVGVEADIPTSAADALDVALQMQRAKPCGNPEGESLCQ